MRFFSFDCATWHRIFVRQPGTEARPIVVKAWSPNHGAARRVPHLHEFKQEFKQSQAVSAACLGQRTSGTLCHLAGLQV